MPMTDREIAFVEAICKSPEDDLPRLVYADWLDEHDRPERAEFIRVQCELAKVGPQFEESMPKSLGLPDARHVGGGEFVIDCFNEPPVGSRIDARTLSLKRKAVVTLRGLRVIRTTDNRSGGVRVNAVRDEYSGAEAAKRIAALRRRERELLSKNKWDWLTETYPTYFIYANEPDEFGLLLRQESGDTTKVRLTFRRGFVEEVTCTAEDALRLGDRLTWGWDECGRCTNGKLLSSAGSSGGFYQSPVDCPACSGSGRVPPTMECPTCGNGMGKPGVGKDAYLIGAFGPFPKGCPHCQPTGRVARPCPPTAQPITTVRLTTEPDAFNGVEGWLEVTELRHGRDRRAINPRFPGITFHLPTENQVRLVNVTPDEAWSALPDIREEGW